MYLKKTFYLGLWKEFTSSEIPALFHTAYKIYWNSHGPLGNSPTALILIFILISDDISIEKGPSDSKAKRTMSETPLGVDIAKVAAGGKVQLIIFTIV